MVRRAIALLISLSSVPGLALAQGSVAGVPAKIWLPDAADPDRAFLVATAAASATLAERIGWTVG